MVKVKDRAKLLWCLRQFDHGKATQKWLCTYLGIKPRRFRQIYSIYKQTKTVPDFGSKVGRPAKKIPAEWTKIVETNIQNRGSTPIIWRRSFAKNRN